MSQTPTPAEIVAKVRSVIRDELAGANPQDDCDDVTTDVLSALRRAGFVVVPRADVEEASMLLAMPISLVFGMMPKPLAKDISERFAAHLKSEPQT